MVNDAISNDQRMPYAHCPDWRAIFAAHPLIGVWRFFGPWTLGAGHYWPLEGDAVGICAVHSPSPQPSPPGGGSKVRPWKPKSHAPGSRTLFLAAKSGDGIEAEAPLLLYRRTHGLPLPGGEGWGEGEGSFRISFAQFFPSPSW